MQVCDVESFRVNYKLEAWGSYRSGEEGRKRLYIMHYHHVVFLKSPLHSSWLGP